MCGNTGAKEVRNEKEEMEVLSCAWKNEIFVAIYFVCKIHICQACSSNEIRYQINEVKNEAITRFI
jgi:hypothetical protein